MKCTQFYPVLMTGQVADTARFFIDHLRFKALFESDWYVHLQSSEDDTVNLAVLQKDHDTVPKAARGASAGGVLLNFEVANVDAEYARAQQTGLKIVLPLRDEDFGQRHFITEDPNGIAIDVIKPIPPSAEFARQYAPDSLPR